MVKVPAIGFGDAFARSRAPYDDRRGIENRQCQHDDRYDNRDRDRRLARTDNRHGGKDIADEERAGVAEKDFCRIEIIRQKAQGRTRKRNDDERDDRARVQNRDRKEKQTRDQGEAGEQAVEPIDEVDRVHHADVPQKRQRNRKPDRKVDPIRVRVVIERVRDARNDEAVEHRDERHDNLR